MNIEDLSKTQLLLLTILVNFVTAIATAVLTVSLLDSAPAYVTQTINSVVERTVQTVATSTPLGAVITPKPVVIPPSDEERLTNAIAVNATRTVYLYIGATTTPEIATGTYLPKARAIVTATQSALPKDVLVAFADGSTASASISKSGATLTIYGFADAAVLPKVSSPALVKSTDVRLGQTVVAVSRDTSIVTGIVTKVDGEGVHATLSNVPTGAALVNLAGDLVGISIGVANTFASSDKIQTLLTASSTPSL